MKNQIFTIENGCQTWDLSACETASQLMFFDGLLDYAAEAIDCGPTDFRVGELLVKNYIDPPLPHGFCIYK